MAVEVGPEGKSSSWRWNSFSISESEKFQFKQNPYFSDSEIEKEFHLHDDDLPSGPTSTAIKWLPGKSLVA
jgi:hypothetical protein